MTPSIRLAAARTLLAVQSGRATLAAELERARRDVALDTASRFMVATGVVDLQTVEPCLLAGDKLRCRKINHVQAETLYG